ncbi:MAG: sulfur oxidation c-type cytochrome SoxX [Burkholderiaceae bacterium]
MKTTRSTRLVLLAVAGAAVVAVVGCASGPSAEELNLQFQAMMKGSFRSEGIATVDRLDQDAGQQACSTGQPPSAAVAQRIQAEALATVKPPSDGRYLGDWREGEKLAQNGRGMTWTDKSAAASANGASCYNCHQIGPAEISFGTIGPSLYHYGRTHGAADPAAPAAAPVLQYTWGKLNNAWAYNACSNMPRFGHKRLLDETQLKHLMALLLDPASPVNAN